MDWLDRMNSAMDYIETNLTDEISYDTAAKFACCSTYHFQRMFSFITNVPLSEYIRRRRLTLAAFELQTSNIKVIDVALKYGYESPEAFSRAFKNLHGVMPVSARDIGVVLKAYPKMTFSISIKGDAEMNYRIEKKEPFEVCGISTEINAIDGESNTILPKFWQENRDNGNIRRFREAIGMSKEEYVNGVIYNFREEAFSYMICYYTPESGVPDGYASLSVPEFTWAVFSSPEHPDAECSEQIQRIWERIFSEWFPTSGYEHANGPEFEMYLNKGNDMTVSEVWIPIIKK